VRIVFISDTHGKHGELGTLRGDVLVHCGDFCNGFMNHGHSLAEIDEWFGDQLFDIILCVGGNHDFLAESRYKDGQPVFRNATYLVDAAYEWNGLSFYGSPWLPDLDGWAHFLSDHDRKRKWELIPDSTDILITHTPPFGLLDKPRSGRHIGCSFLRAVVDRVRPRIHCFGHVHASSGCITESGTEFINATVINSDIEVINPPVVRELDVDG
jgi:predicted phosphodiesterase